MNRCIYCNSTDVNKSDIIPYSLTHNKLKRKFTCEAHNSYVGSNYEYEIASKTAILRNLFDFMYRSSGKMVDFPALVIMNNVEFKVEHFTSVNDLFWNDTELLGSDGKKHKFTITSREDIEAHSGTIQIKYPSVNECIHILFSSAMEKLAAKICYEYYCYDMGINYFNTDSFGEIVSYITNKDLQNNGIVSLVDDPILSSILKSEFGLGSTTIFYYTEPSGVTYGVFRLWDLVTYRVKLYTSPVFRSISTIEGFWSAQYDGTMRKAEISRLSIFSGVKLAVDKQKILDEAVETIISFFKEPLLTSNALRTTKNRLKEILASSRPLSDKLAYFFGLQDTKVITTLWTILNIYDRRESWDEEDSFDKNVRKILNVSGDKMIISKSYFDKFSDKQSLEIEKILRDAIAFYEAVTKKR